MNTLQFSFAEVVQLILCAFAIGTLFQQVRSLAKRQDEHVENTGKMHTLALEKIAESEAKSAALINAVSERQERIDLRTVTAIEGLSVALTRLTTDLKVTLATQDTRLAHLEQEHVRERDHRGQE